MSFCIADQGTQTDSLLITEDSSVSGLNSRSRAKSETHEEGAARNDAEHSPSPQREIVHKIHKSSSFSSSSGNSQGASSPLGSATSTTSLHYSPIRPAKRTLKSDTINTYQKWETTIESISYVSSKTLAISDYGSDAERTRSDSISNHSHSTRSRSTTPVPGPVPAARSATKVATPTSSNSASMDSSSNSSSGIDSGSACYNATYKATTTTTRGSNNNFNGSRICDSKSPKLIPFANGSPLSVKQT
ncbi:PREDICTED: putative protein TPRXL, partial [Rhagoletis zephyria]|uniref:putative protein TPRXL n=1 Tax=Rhagoletis zephyria TaxID=28612 RepID=UPI0008119317